MASDPNQLTCLYWARGKEIPCWRKDCISAHHFFPTVVERSCRTDHKQQLCRYAADCEWPDDVCAWSHFNDKRHEKENEGEGEEREEANTFVQISPQQIESLIRDRPWYAYLVYRCKDCGDESLDVEQITAHSETCPGRRGPRPRPVSTHGSQHTATSLRRAPSSSCRPFAQHSAPSPVTPMMPEEVQRQQNFRQSPRPEIQRQVDRMEQAPSTPVDDLASEWSSARLHLESSVRQFSRPRVPRQISTTEQSQYTHSADRIEAPAIPDLCKASFSRSRIPLVPTPPSSRIGQAPSTPAGNSGHGGAKASLRKEREQSQRSGQSLERGHSGLSSTTEQAPLTPAEDTRPGSAKRRVLREREQSQRSEQSPKATDPRPSMARGSEQLVPVDDSPTTVPEQWVGSAQARQILWPSSELAAILVNDSRFHLYKDKPTNPSPSSRTHQAPLNPTDGCNSPIPDPEVRGQQSEEVSMPSSKKWQKGKMRESEATSEGALSREEQYERIMRKPSWRAKPGSSTTTTKKRGDEW